MPIDYNNDELKATIASTSSIGIDPLGPYTTHYYGPPPQKMDAIQDLRDRHDDNRRDIEDMKNITQMHDMRICQQDREIYEIREKVKEALAIVQYPGLIANRMLDKLCEFVAKHKKVLTDKKTGVTTEMIEVSDLAGAIDKIREVIKNGNNM